MMLFNNYMFFYDNNLFMIRSRLVFAAFFALVFANHCYDADETAANDADNNN